MRRSRNTFLLAQIGRGISGLGVNTSAKTLSKTCHLWEADKTCSMTPWAPRREFNSFGLAFCRRRLTAVHLAPTAVANRKALLLIFVVRFHYPIAHATANEIPLLLAFPRTRYWHLLIRWLKTNPPRAEPPQCSPLCVRAKI